jgi:4-hydroxy-tetrahydrodipicolinate synthase
VEPDTIARLAELTNITMIKEAAGSLDQVSQIICTTNLTVLSGDDSLTLPMLAVGARGVISVVGNIVPRDMMALLDAFERGDVRGAREWHQRLFPLCRDLLSLATNPIPIKAALKLLGRDSGELRMPMTPLADDEQNKLRDTLVAYGLVAADRGAP